MKIFTLVAFIMFTLVACGEKPKETTTQVVVVPEVSAPVVAPTPVDAEMSMDATPAQ